MTPEPTDSEPTDSDTEAGTAADAANDTAAAAAIDTESVSYEAARAELSEVMRALESGGQSLEESLALWHRGEQLADVCQRWLDAASRRLDEAIEAANAEPGTSD